MQIFMSVWCEHLNLQLLINRSYAWCSYFTTKTRMVGQNTLLYLPTQIRFLIGGEHHMSLVKTSWRPRANKTSWSPRATTTWTFNLHVISSFTFETVANLFASPIKQIIFYAVVGAKWFQTTTEEEIEQLPNDKSSKSTNKATNNAVRMWLFN